jgi:putative addiction module killer protein
MMEGRERSIEYYFLRGEVAPFGLWRDRIGDKRARAAIDARIARLRGGNFGDSKPIGEGAFESRIDFGPGYRIYYGVYGDRIVLLCGGDKSTQRADIGLAIRFWSDYKEQMRQHGAKPKL